MIGQTISHYKITAKLGEGGMGEVFLATDTQLDRLVALKFLPTALSHDPDSRARLRREAQAASQLNHPNILTIHSVGEFEGRDFIVMEYVEGQTLAAVLQQGPMPVAEVRRMAVAIASGLAAAHKRNVIHRDIKPTNVMITKDGNLKIMDFGLAKLTGRSDLTKAGTIVGTVSYMPPEQVQGLPTDQRSDVFSLGILLYELLTGRRPFSGSHDPAIMYAILNEEPRPPRQYNSSVPAGLESVVLKALAKVPSARYPDAGALLSDLLESDKTGETVASPPISVTEKPVTQRTRSLAVLYLRNLGPSDDEFLSYGITEDLIVDLTRIGSLRVSPMRSILKLRDSEADLPEIATALDVGLILDGSIQRLEKTIRVSVQLVDISTKKNLWAERWEEAAENLPRIKQALAAGIGKALEVDSSVVRAAQVGRPEGTNPLAYEFYLRGKYSFQHKKDESDVRVAREMYQRALGEEPSLVAARTALAELMIFEGDNSGAQRELEAVLADARTRGLRADESNILGLLAWSHDRQCKYPAAEQLAREAIQVSRELGDLAGEARSTGTLIKILDTRARFDEALQHFERVLEINRSLDDRERENEALVGIASVYLGKADFRRVRALTDEALDNARKYGYTLLEASCIGLQGAVCYHEGKFDEALQYHENCLAICRRIGFQDGIAGTLINMASSYSAKGDFRKALELFGRADVILKGLKQSRIDPYLSINMGAMLAILGEYDRAIDLMEGALDSAMTQDLPVLVAAAHQILGYAYLHKGDFVLAESSLQKSLDLAEKVGIRETVAENHVVLSELYFHMKRYDLCRQHAEYGLTIGETIGKKDIKLKAAAYLAALMVRDGAFADGIQQLRGILSDAYDFGTPMGILIAQRLLGQALLEYAPTAVNRSDGRTSLEAALEFAREKEIAYEIQWIEGVLAASG